jgi:hypothetical protein
VGGDDACFEYVFLMAGANRSTLEHHGRDGRAKDRQIK